jgi:hypothetical protein
MEINCFHICYTLIYYWSSFSLFNNGAINLYSSKDWMNNELEGIREDTMEELIQALLLETENIRI